MFRVSRVGRRGVLFPIIAIVVVRTFVGGVEHLRKIQGVVIIRRT